MGWRSLCSENESPPEARTLKGIFPGLRGNSAAEILLAPIDGFVGVSRAADEANFAATMALYNSLIGQIQRLDPKFVDEQLLPPGGIEGLDWQGRDNLIAGLRMKLAAEYYLIKGDIRPLQGETLVFLRGAVDKAYDQAVSKADAGRLTLQPSREVAIGNEADSAVRRRLKDLLSTFEIPYGPKQEISINNRDYETTDGGSAYRIPDARLGDVVYDWTLSMKTLSDAQIRSFFRADSQPSAVVIVRPSQLGGHGTYLIHRPDESRLRR